MYLNIFKSIQGGPKKNKLTAIILSNLNRFSKSVNRKILQKIAVSIKDRTSPRKRLHLLAGAQSARDSHILARNFANLTISPHRKYVATLPCNLSLIVFWQ